MNTHNAQEDKSVCPRCARSFVCRVDQIEACDCMKLKVVITPALREQLANKYSGCLCNTCLTELAQNGL